jgi:phage portal protein BeeE
MPIRVRVPQRATQGLPQWVNGGSGMGAGKQQAIPKPTPYNLRRFSESPIPRRAINAVKDPVSSLKWEIRAIAGADARPDQPGRIKGVTYSLNHPNHDDSFRSFWEQVIEDVQVGAYGSIEMARSNNPDRPLWLWPVDGSTIQLYPLWTGKTSEPRYAQVTGYSGIRIDLRNDELVYIKTNARTSTPFGLSPLEVAFETIGRFLAAHDTAAKTAGSQQPRGILDTGECFTPEQVSAYRSYWRNEVEGRGMMPIIGGTKSPSFIPLFKGDDSDMRMGWQEFLIRIIAVSFNLSPMTFGLERDVNRNTADVQNEGDDDNAIRPVARLVAEHINREMLHRKLGYTDLELVWLDLDRDDDEAMSRIHGAYLDRDVMLPDEAREKMGLEPLKGGWGALTLTQRQILIAQAAKTGAESHNPATQDLADDYPPIAPQGDPDGRHPDLAR